MPLQRPNRNTTSSLRPGGRLQPTPMCRVYRACTERIHKGNALSRCAPDVPEHPSGVQLKNEGDVIMRSVLLWILGVPLSVIIILNLTGII